MKTPQDPAAWRPSTHSRGVSIARHEGPCDRCENRILVGQHIQRIRGQEMHIACAGKE